MSLSDNIRDSLRIERNTLVVWILGFIGDVVSFGTAGWFYVETFPFSFSVGLWQICSSSTSIFDVGCKSISSSKTLGHISWWRGLQAMMTLGVIFAAIGLTLSVLFIVTSSLKTTTVNIACFTCKVAAVLFNIIGIAVFMVKISKEYSSDDTYYYWSFYVGWVAIGTFLLGVSLSVTGLRRRGREIVMTRLEDCNTS